MVWATDNTNFVLQAPCEGSGFARLSLAIVRAMSTGGNRSRGQCHDAGTFCVGKVVCYQQPLSCVPGCQLSICWRTRTIPSCPAGRPHSAVLLTELVDLGPSTPIPEECTRTVCISGPNSQDSEKLRAGKMGGPSLPIKDGGPRS